VQQSFVFGINEISQINEPARTAVANASFTLIFPSGRSTSLNPKTLNIILIDDAKVFVVLSSYTLGINADIVMKIE
jgi:hypothetical protein